MFGSSHPGLALPKGQPRVVERRAIKAAKAQQWRELRRIVKKRDGGRCRCCQRTTTEVHHLLYRSAGGKSDARNTILLCRPCHQDVHAKLLRVTWTSGEAA